MKPGLTGPETTGGGASALRIATVRDIDAMHVVRLAVRENVLSSPSRVTVEHYRAMLEQGGRGWVFEEHGRIVGFAVADAARRNVWALFVDPAHEGRGIGRALHDAMVDWMFEVGTEPIWLTTGPGTRAERFYVAAGWTRKAQLDDGEILFEMARKPDC